MRNVFADSGYWIALLNPKDDLHNRAKEVSSSLGAVRIFTSEMVLSEVLNSFADKGPTLRRIAVTLVENLHNDPNTEIIPQTSLQFNEALRLYQNRQDKDWSLTDCASILIIRERGMTETLAYDNHFSQAGLIPLLRIED